MLPYRAMVALYQTLHLFNILNSGQQWENLLPTEVGKDISHYFPPKGYETLNSQKCNFSASLFKTLPAHSGLAVTSKVREVDTWHHVLLRITNHM